MRHGRVARAFVLLLAAAAGFAQPRADELAEPVRAALAESLERTPKYTCTETIERVSPGDCQLCRVMDRVRLDVIVANGMDMYALPGSQVTSDAELRKYVPAGSFYAGNFSGTLKGILLDAAERRFVRKVEGDGPPLLEFSYRVPTDAGAYELGWGGAFARAGYQGTFRVEAGSHRLNRLEASAFGIPRGWNLERLTSKTVYQTVRIGGSPFSLPATSDVEARAGGLDYRIRIRFSGCRQYGAESAIHFEDTPPEVHPLGAPAREIPARAVFEAELDSPVHFSNAAAGDRLAAHVTSKGGAVPKGSVLRGRISRLVRSNRPDGAERWLIGMRFTELEIGGAVAPFRGILQVERPEPILNHIRAGEEILFQSPRTTLAHLVLRCTVP